MDDNDIQATLFLRMSQPEDLLAKKEREGKAVNSSVVWKLS